VCYAGGKILGRVGLKDHPTQGFREHLYTRPLVSFHIQPDLIEASTSAFSPCLFPKRDLIFLPLESSPPTIIVTPSLSWVTGAVFKDQNVSFTNSFLFVGLAVPCDSLFFPSLGHSPVPSCLCQDSVKYGFLFLFNCFPLQNCSPHPLPKRFHPRPLVSGRPQFSAFSSSSSRIFLARCLSFFFFSFFFH